MMAATLPPAQTLCHGCLSADRDLSPIGEFVSIYTRICNDKTALDIKDANLCWECTASLKRMQLFYAQVNEAQTILKFYRHTKDLQKSLPKSLSKLEIAKTNHDYISLTGTDELELDIEFVKSSGPGYQISLSKLEEIKQEDKEDDNFDNTDILDAKSHVNDVKDEIFDFASEVDYENDDKECDPSYIVDYKNNKKSKKANKVGDVKTHCKTAHRKFLCDHCGMKKPNKSSIELHITRHHMENKCKLCSRTFRDYYKLNAHIAYMHGKNSKRRKKKLRYKTELEMQYCHISTAEEMCLKEQARPSDLANLLERDGSISQGSDSNTMCTELFSMNENTAIQKSDDQNELKPHTCKICHAHYPTLEELSSHVTSHDVYRCLVCGHRSPSMEAAGQHVTQHKNIIKCLLCEYCCGKKRDVTAHYKIAHTEFSCEHCKLKKSSKSSIERHITRHHMENKCKYCSRTYRDYYKLNSHMARLHANPNKGGKKKLLRNKTELQMQYCYISTAEELCVKEQARPSDLVNLWERHGCISQGSDSNTMCKEQCSKNDNTVIQKSDDQNELKPHTCKICHAHYPTLEELSSHVTSHDVYRCLVCGHRSPSMEAAGHHVTRHGKIIKCLLCEYCCRKKRDIIAHYKMAHTEFWCEHCKMNKPTKSSIERHITRLHMENKCKQCSRVYRDYYKLNSHIARMHSNRKKRRKKTELEIQYCHISTAEEMCVKEQARPSELSSHATSHDVYRCLVCGHRSPRMEAAGQHVTQHGEIIKCMLCEYCSVNVLDVEAHYEIAHTEFLCGHCEKKHRRKSLLELHITRHHMDNKCPQCSKALRNYTQLRSHLTRVHGDPAAGDTFCAPCNKQFKVTQCSKALRNYIQLRSHLTRVHGDPAAGQTFCAPCNKQFKNHFKYTSHLKNSTAHLEKPRTNRYKCDQCPKSYPWKSTLTKHIDKVHQTYETEETFCATCVIQFQNRMRLKNHLRTRAHRIKSGLKVERFECTTCDKSYATKRRLTEHYDVEHLGIRTYYCKDCDKVFKDASTLKCHIRYIHEGVQKIKDKLCSVCGRGFASNETLKNHMRTHTGERPHACAVCDARFAQKTARDAHQKRHSAKNNRVDRLRGVIKVNDGSDDDDDNSSSE